MKQYSCRSIGQVDESGGSGGEDTGDASDTGVSDTGDTGSFSDMDAGGEWMLKGLIPFSKHHRNKTIPIIILYERSLQWYH